MDPATIETRLRDFLASRAKEEGIAAAWLFGSGRDHLGMLMDEDPGIQDKINLILERELTELLGSPLRVVLLNHAAAELIVRVLREGDLLVQPNRARRVQFEVDSQNEHWDFEPYLQLYRGKNGLPLAPPLEELVERHLSRQPSMQLR